MNLIRTYSGEFSSKERKLLVDEFTKQEDKSLITLTLDKSSVGETAYMAPAAEAESRCLRYTSEIVDKYILETQGPFLFSSLRDEGYQIQRWWQVEEDKNLWISTEAIDRKLCVIQVLKGKDAEIEFKYDKSIRLTPGKTIIFPTLFSHLFRFNIKTDDLYIITTYIRLNTDE